MTRGRGIAVALAALATGCAWSNSLYQARRFSREAAQAERDHRTGDAMSLWGQVIFRAESAYARAPGGARGAEALWLIGHSYARTNDCAKAIPALEGALLSRPDPRWRQQLLLELGQCDELTGSPTAASIYAMLIASETDPALLRLAHFRQGHVFVAQGRWEAGLAALTGLDTLPARLDRATALAEVGRTREAFAELSPALARADTGVKWREYVELFAARNSAWTDSLLARLLAFSDVRDEQRSAWLLAGARAAVAFDPAASARRLHALAVRPAGRSTGEGQVLQWELRIVGSMSVAELRAVLDSLRRIGEPTEGSGLAALAGVRQDAQRLVDKNDSTPQAARRGDLTMFALAEFARDTLHAPALATWFFGRLERDWPASPYVPKALMAVTRLSADSEPAILARVRRYTASPYVLAADGDLGAQARLVPLEDSLRRFIGDFWSNMPAAARVVQERE